MITKMKHVYYCEHCGRHRLTPNSILKHEKGCTLNPNRRCGVCETSKMQELLAKYKDSFTIIEDTDGMGYPNETSHWRGEPLTLENLRDDTGGCPVCILAVIRQCNLNRSPGDFFNFEYKAEHKAYWDELNSIRRQEADEKEYRDSFY